MKRLQIYAHLCGLSFGLIGLVTPSLALPPPEDTPEEILRTKIILEARSRLDGQPLTPAEYAQLQADLAESPYPPELSPQVREIIFLLQIRQMLRILTPL